MITTEVQQKTEERKPREAKARELCSSRALPIRDTLDLLGGKWKLPIIYTLLDAESLRFKELQRELHGITARMLSKELKELEVNYLIKRQVYDTAPPTVIYSLTDYGCTLKSVIIELHKWGSKHRERVFKAA